MSGVGSIGIVPILFSPLDVCLKMGPYTDGERASRTEMDHMISKDASAASPCDAGGTSRKSVVSHR